MALVGPHAGFSYCGTVLGSTYKHLPADCKRVVIMGPSHHVYLRRPVLSQADAMETPLGRVAVDRASVDELFASGQFDWFDPDADEAEHSIEMHLPFLQRAAVAAGMASAPSVVPIVIGGATAKHHREIARAIAPLLRTPGTVLAVSTDFCHWGRRFEFTHGLEDRTKAVHESIRSLDMAGMSVSLRRCRPAALARAAPHSTSRRSLPQSCLACTPADPLWATPPPPPPHTLPRCALRCAPPVGRRPCRRCGPTPLQSTWPRRGTPFAAATHSA